MINAASARSYRGFTLVELLACICIIGILAAILLPLAGYVRENARGSQCASNQRQIYTALMLYHNDNKRLPQLQNGLVSGILPANQPFWNQQLLPYFDRQTTDLLPDFFQCPSDSLANNGRGDYGVNYNDIVSPGLIRTSRYSSNLKTVNRPERAILLADAQQMNGTEVIGAWYFTNTAVPNSSGNANIASRHRGGANVVFADGHVIWMETTKIYSTYMPWQN
jgi:prepilin-type N-terminal cleavage/methylation domain-containing protein/prepilin-type processing-associated H-X9-DG protein